MTRGTDAIACGRVASPELCGLAATELTAGFESGLFTPSEALSAVYGRLDEINPRINAVVATNRADAEAAAMRATERWRSGTPLSALDGVPITVKDNLHVAGLPATWGSRLYRDFAPALDEPAVARLRAAGAVIVGKTNVPEFTLQGYTSNLLFGTTFNPWAPGRTPGGSTGGGAAAVAAGIGPIAIGTDGGGSIRRPAAHCGLWGLKPSLEQIARDGGFPQILADFEVIGPLARTLNDVAAAFAVLRGHDPRDVRSLAATASLPPWQSPLRVAYMPAIGAAPVDPLIRHEADRTAARLGPLGCAVETVDAPFDADEVTAVWSGIAQVGLAVHLVGLPHWQTVVSPATKAMAELGAARSTQDYVQSLAAAARIRAAAGAFFEHHDILLCPSIAALAWPADQAFPPLIDGRGVGPRGHAVFTAWMNVAGLAAVNVPAAMTPADGGIGLQFVAAAGRDGDLLQWLQGMT